MIRLLFIGDIFGRPGRDLVRHGLAGLVEYHNIDLVIANAAPAMTFVLQHRNELFPNVPVVFITAYPEKLMTGERPEPTFLITKPFQPETVKAAIGQALFFHPRKAKKQAA